MIRLEFGHVENVFELNPSESFIREQVIKFQ